MKKIMIVLAATAAIFSSCKKEESFNDNAKGPISVEFDNIAGVADFQLNTSYTNSSSEVFKVSKLKYYVSNFAFTKTDGTVYTVSQNESYFLVDETSGTEQEAEFDIPEGEYKTVSFTLGVDSTRAKMAASERTGVLDVSGSAADMYFNSATGYIFMNAEGQSAASGSGSFSFHIGGYSPAVNNLKTITLDLSARGTAKVKEGKETNIHLMVDFLNFFTGTNNISISAHPVVGYEAFSTIVSANFNGMFRHDHTEN